jgi:hypothetical protein
MVNFCGRDSDHPPRPLAGGWGVCVRSRSEVGWIVSESAGLVCPSFADVLVGSEPPQGLEALSEVVGVEEGFEVLSELPVKQGRIEINFPQFVQLRTS